MPSALPNRSVVVSPVGGRRRAELIEDVGLNLYTLRGAPVPAAAGWWYWT